MILPMDIRALKLKKYRVNKKYTVDASEFDPSLIRFI